MNLTKLNSFITIPNFLNLDSNKLSPSWKKFLLLSTVALTTIALTTWQVIKQNRKLAFAICIGGACSEIALGIFFSSKAKKNLNILPNKPLSTLSTPSTATFLRKLEAAYPVKAIDPVDPKRIERQQKLGLLGMACGDAIGLYTEFTTEAQAKQMINGKNLDFDTNYPSTFINGHNWSHIKRFIKNGWTDDTDQALCLLRAMYRQRFPNDQEKSFSFDRLFARELMKWRKGGLAAEDGFKGRSNPYCMGLGALVCAVLNQSSFLDTPIQAAIETWASDTEKSLKNRPAANGALMRTTPIALVYYQSFLDVIQFTIQACSVTHADPRCTASCVAVNMAIALILRGYDIQTVLKISEETGLFFLKQGLKDAAAKRLLPKAEIADIDNLCKVYENDFSTHFHGDWSFLDLDEGYEDTTKMNKIGYTFKCMGAAFHALRLANQYQNQQTNSPEKNDPFRAVIQDIAKQGGDADTNGAVAGAMVAAFLGAKVQHITKEWTDKIADVDVLDQGVQHVIELSNTHSKQLKST